MVKKRLIWLLCEKIRVINPISIKWTEKKIKVSLGYFLSLATW